MKLPEDQVRYVDIPELSETFADSLGGLMFDGQSARIEFCITRMDIPKPEHGKQPQKPTAKKYPCCRMVLTPETFQDLYNQLNQIVTAMQQQGKMSASQGTGGGNA